MRTSFTMSSDTGVDPLLDRTSGSTDTKISLRRRIKDLSKRLNTVNNGTHPSLTTFRYGERPAFGTLVVSAASGTIGAVINGVTVTVTHAISDLNDAALIAAAINTSADALVANLVQASNYSATITLASARAGTVIDVAGVRFLAVASVPSAPVFGEFTIVGNDTADATALAAAINLHPLLRDRVRAIGAAAVVTLLSIPAVPVNKNITNMSLRTVPFAIGALVVNTNVVTGVTVAPHGLILGDIIALTGSDALVVNGSYTIVSAPTPTTLTFALTTTNGASTSVTSGAYTGGVATTGILALSTTVGMHAINLGTVGNCVTTVASGTGITVASARLINGTTGVISL